MPSPIKRLVIGITVAALAVAGLQQVGLIDTARAISAPNTSTRCGITAAWTGATTHKLKGGITVKQWKRTISDVLTGYCFQAHRTKVAKKTNMSLYATSQNGVSDAGRYTSGKTLNYYVTVWAGDIKTITLKIWKKKGDAGVTTVKSYTVTRVR